MYTKIIHISIYIIIYISRNNGRVLIPPIISFDYVSEHTIAYKKMDNNIFQDNA